MPHQAGEHSDVIRRGSGVRRYVNVTERFAGDRIPERPNVHQQERIQFAQVRNQERGGDGPD